jgi:hypothetical protein
MNRTEENKSRDDENGETDYAMNRSSVPATG